MNYKIYNKGQPTFIVERNDKCIKIYDADYEKILGDVKVSEPVFTIDDYASSHYEEKMVDDEPRYNLSLNDPMFGKRPLNPVIYTTSPFQSILHVVNKYGASIILLGNVIIVTKKRKSCSIVDSMRVSDGEFTLELCDEWITRDGDREPDTKESTQKFCYEHPFRSRHGESAFVRFQKTVHKTTHHAIITKYSDMGVMNGIDVYKLKRGENESMYDLHLGKESRMFEDNGAYLILSTQESTPTLFIICDRSENNFVHPHVIKLYAQDKPLDYLNITGFRFIPDDVWWIVLSGNKIFACNGFYYPDSKIDPMNVKLVSALIHNTRSEGKGGIRYP